MTLSNKEKEKKLIDTIIEHALPKQRFIIIFDGRNTMDTLGSHYKEKQCQIMFTPYGETADEKICQKIKNIQNKKEITIVTSDNAILYQAKKKKIKTLSSDQFLKILFNQNIKATEEKPTHTNTDYWLKKFTENK